jgi:glycosyl hydrolase family 44
MRIKYWLVALCGISLVGALLTLRVRQVARRAAAASASSEVGARPSTALVVAEIVYDGKLADGWSDWGWGPHQIPKAGPAQVGFGGYGGIVLHHAELRSSFGAFSFRYKAPDDWPRFLAVTLKRTGTPEASFRQVAVEARHELLLPDGWREVLIEWGDLDPANLPFDRVAIIARASVSIEPVLLDKIVFTKAASDVLRDAPSRPVELGISCQGSGQQISPLIYGAAVGDWASGQSAERIGGNMTSRLNWDAGDLWNTGSDWFFENTKANGTLWDWLDADAKRGAPAAVTVPIIGWVAKDATSVGFPKSKYPKQRKYDVYRVEAGDGYAADGSKIKPGSPSETSIAAPPEMIGRWIKTVRDKDHARGKRSVQMYILDNEPSLWNSTHRDIHPDPLSSDELLDRTIRYATEIRKADPDAVIAGPAEWGWRGYFFSGKDQAVDSSLRPDRRAHGDLPLIAWYLQKLAEHEHSSGDRLLDVLDVHFYPAADGMYGANARVDADGAQLRLRSTRALWDPTYKDESWINEPIRLIPRLKSWVAENYPGRKISIGEWSFGADDHISGGLATAEALGRFGQQGLDSAFFWGGPKAGTPTFWAFRAYRNFDGHGARFLDVSLPTRESEKVSLFASRDEIGTHIVAVIVNRDPSFAVDVALNLAACGRVASRRVFSYGPASTALAEVATDKARDPRLPVDVGPYSFAVVDLHVDRP